MNHPIWDVPASGLPIAAVAIVHVFVSHFAVGGGPFLVLAEHKARREADAVLPAFVRRLSRFFILLTLVFGASRAWASGSRSGSCIRRRPRCSSTPSSGAVVGRA